MNKGEFEESVKFNLSDIVQYSSNNIVVKNILVRNTCVIQVLLFDFGKVQVYKK
jgi:hypothetical protein